MVEHVHEVRLTSQQRKAVTTQDRDVLVTAGAGSGKTRTLVARYLAMLEAGVSPREMAAITFTEKAAREMRNRVRLAVTRAGEQSTSTEERAFWDDLEAQMDAARIGTIHSLCAEILRVHPVEAKIDPDFDVVDEGLAAALKAQAVEEALAWAAGDQEIALLYQNFSPHHLMRSLSFLIERRLDAGPMLEDRSALDRGWVQVTHELTAFTNAVEVEDSVKELKSMQSEGALVTDAGPKLASHIEDLLVDWEDIESALDGERTLEAAQGLFRLRREMLAPRTGKRESRAKAIVRQLKEIYDELLDPWLGGSKGSDQPPAHAIESRYREALPRLSALFAYAAESYRSELDARYALDFDDLESKALLLLEREEIRESWRSKLNLVLVDEFQDTNDRQQRIVMALTGGPGSLFVVGDSRQSIYRFRGADVTVFRRMQENTLEEGGEVVELDLTFRSHPDLLRALDDLLEPIMGSGSQGELYRVPYTPLRSHRDAPNEGVEPSYVEVLCGIGESAPEARPIAARALCGRLLELRGEGQIHSWDEVALLFRASTGFPVYEDALEALGIPFVTIAGRGFYDRPEIRDVLNMLQALADPGDDLAMAGLLRSPAFGLTDEALYRLRWIGKKKRTLWSAIQEGSDELSEEDLTKVERARMILEELIPRVDRLPVAELLKSLMDRTDYRAALASAHSRLWQNLDKLLQDAHESGMVRVREFLDYIQTLRDVGVREGEAPAEAEGAVRLMTIHKAKGLEFDVVVLADASRGPGGRVPAAYLLAETGLAVRPDLIDDVPLVPRLAHWIEGKQSKAESDRLLYVALTRTREKLLISGHLTLGQRGLRVIGWLKELFESMEVDVASIVEMPGQWHPCSLKKGESVAIAVMEDEVELKVERPSEVEWPVSTEKELFSPIPEFVSDGAEPEESSDPIRVWRATGERIRAPAAAVGWMVHQVIQRWLPPDDPQLDSLLEALGLQQGLVDTGQRRRAVRESRRLLARFWEDPLREEIDVAFERHHELPYERKLTEKRMDLGSIDLLFRDERGWVIVDFKTDELRDADALQAAVKKHRPQVMRYVHAVNELLNEEAEAILCFLDAEKAVAKVSVTMGN